MELQLLQRCIAQAAARNIDDAFEREIVRRLVDEAQIGERVADLGALVEARAADDAIGQAERDKTVLELAHLERGAHQNGDLFERMAGALQVLDLIADRARLFLAIPRAGDRDLLARLVLGAQRLAEPAFVMRDQVRGGAQDVGGRAVVALQPDDFGAGEVLLEPQDIVDLGAAPAVDRLIVIANTADVLGTLTDQPQPEILRDVGVLIFIDQHVFETLMVLPQHFRVLAEQAQHLDQQIAKVGRIERFQPRLIGLVKLDAAPAREGRGLTRRHLVGRQPTVLPAVNDHSEHARRPSFFIDIPGL